MSLRRRISILVAIGLTPPFLLTMVNTARWQIHLEADVRQDAMEDARLFSTEIGGVIEGARQFLVTLSKYPPGPADEAECTAYFKAAIADFPIYREAAIIDGDGKFHCSTIPIPPTLNVKDRVYFAEPIKTGQFTIGRFTQGRVTNASSIHLSMPYRAPDGTMSGVIVVIANPEKIAEQVARLPRRTSDRIVVVDRTGAVVFTFPLSKVEEAAAIARAALPKLNIASPKSVDIELDERPQIIGAAPVLAGSDNLGVIVAVDRTKALADAWVFAARNLAIALAAIVLAIFGAWLATHFLITRPIRALVDVARRRERGQHGVKFPPLRSTTELGELSNALSRMSATVDELLGQKVLLLRELQHRVMNSLNLLSSMFDIQGRERQTTPETREQLGRARNRVVALGTVYRHLYEKEAVDNIEIGQLLRSIGEQSANAYDGPVKLAITVEADTLLMSGTNAIALAMLTHELILNTAKHAYSEGQPAPIYVMLKRKPEGGAVFSFSDRGRGLPDDFKIDKSDSLGMIMITATARQLSGKLTINKLDPGTEFVLDLPASIDEGAAEQKRKGA